MSIDYRGWKVYELPPNGDGIAALEMLQIMQQFTPPADGPLGAAELHTRIEAMKLAYADITHYNGDPKFSSIPVRELLSPEFAASRAKLIDPNRANCNVPPGALHGSDTTYLSVVDKDGNILSLIQSNYDAFGSEVTVRGMGFVLQDRGGLFSLDPKSPNALAGATSDRSTPCSPASRNAARVHIGFRHHRRHRTSPGARAVRVERRRLPHERSGCYGSRSVSMADSAVTS